MERVYAATDPPGPPGTIVTIAGTGQAGFSGDGGPASRATIYYPLGLAVDAAPGARPPQRVHPLRGYPGAPRLYIATGKEIPGNQGNRVRRISLAGIITTVAGSGRVAFSGDGGPATNAGVGAVAMTVDTAGDLYLADFLNNRVRKVSANGIITTFAGGGDPADGLGDGGPATSARLCEPSGVAVDASGNLFIAEHGRHRVRMVTSAGTITTVAGTGQAGFAGDGGPAVAAQLNFPISVLVDNAPGARPPSTNANCGPGTPRREGGCIAFGAPRLYIADVGNHRVRMVGPDGMIRTVAGGGNPADGLGDGGLATEARLDTPIQLALDGAGNLFIADSRSLRIRRVGPVGIISTVAGTGEAGFFGDGGPATQARLSGPFGLAMDKAGNLYFSDIGRFVPPGGAAGGGLETPDNERIREVLGVGVPG
jgi:hypothetical protein